MTRLRPLIGITLDHEPAGGYATTPWYALRENYCAVLQRLGADVIALPYQPERASRFAELCDGLVITGGGFDINPALFTNEPVHASVQLKPARTQAETELLSAFLAQDKPVLGICGGEQLMAAHLGARLHQHIPDAVANALEHAPMGSVANPVGQQAAHLVNIVPNSLLATLTGETQGTVNSSHHQAVSELSNTSDLVINATAPDGVIEGIEHPGYRFCLGVQWHPEFELTPMDTAILSGFLRACC
ncbi:gamma-glutamyl-gamma-aminobutyrate hydrolase family protein [Reinekea sp. G2M2-21]|uniref:gamma-glutamyl-gamma-aminobutyrate hydrolase family protein n=1 Tax=Reinekea sp. G2M2-21 TaxID=2788942 RepID=UPI0018AC4E07|nr:gamma-glutamyl-gamma-aminobutyrate hydrolase family protein [Reinekea sp. G2M2-21]